MLPPETFNRRICVLVERFFEEELKGIYGRHGWQLPSWRKKGFDWDNGHFLVKVVGYHSDKAIKEMQYDLENVPSYTEQKRISYSHRFRLSLPRNYNLHDIRVENLTKLYHPRISRNSVNSKPCLFIKGDIDSILSYLIYFVLLKPDVVLPEGSDNGLNHEATSWYREQGLLNVYQHLLDLWGQHQVILPRSTPKVRILNSKKL